jgi:hypothetical protein
MMSATAGETTKSGTFLGVEVTAGPGGGLASGAPVPSGAAVHYHAARLPDIGDVVLAVARVFDADTGAALRIELRAFTAAAPGRGALAQMPGDELVEAPGAIAFAELELSASGDSADERRAATLTRCVVTDAAPTAAAARGIADWLRTTWETELAFGSWPAVRGTLEAFAAAGDEPADWARKWLVDGEHHVDDADPATFLKVLSPAWLEASSSADS